MIAFRQCILLLVSSPALFAAAGRVVYSKGARTLTG